MADKRTIQDQVRLPLSIAFDVVMQGLRTRLGRSIVTITGVVLGIAFLMSILTSQLARQGVAQEQQLRTEVRRMLSFMTADTGPLDGRTVVIHTSGALEPAEQRLIDAIRNENATIVTTPSAATDTTALLVLGQTPDNLGKLVADARPKVVALSRQPEQAPTITGVTVVNLSQQLRPEELQKQQDDARRERFRAIWIIVISLAVTVIGISNAMLMSVTERFREIGTMKCLGALSSFIRRIFLIESSLVGGVGGVIGTVLGGLFSVAAFSATYGFGLVLGSMNWPMLLAYGLGSIAAAVVLSIIAALYPANFAARMVPATALRTNI